MLEDCSRLVWRGRSHIPTRYRRASSLRRTFCRRLSGPGPGGSWRGLSAPGVRCAEAREWGEGGSGGGGLQLRCRAVSGAPWLEMGCVSTAAEKGVPRVGLQRQKTAWLIRSLLESQICLLYLCLSRCTPPTTSFYPLPLCAGFPSIRPEQPPGNCRLAFIRYLLPCHPAVRGGAAPGLVIPRLGPHPRRRAVSPARRLDAQDGRGGQLADAAAGGEGALEPPSKGAGALFDDQGAIVDDSCPGQGRELGSGPRPHLVHTWSTPGSTPGSGIAALKILGQTGSGCVFSFN